MPHIFYKHHRRKKHASPKKEKHFIDLLVYPMAVIAPIMTLPQLSEIWIKRHVAGVSVITWLAYGLGAGLWAIYGIVHKEKPIILINIILLVLQLSIVAGVLVLR